MALYKIMKLTNVNLIPWFIFTPEQVTNKNKYHSLRSIKLMVESLLSSTSALYV